MGSFGISGRALWTETLKMICIYRMSRGACLDSVLQSECRGNFRGDKSVEPSVEWIVVVQAPGLCQYHLELLSHLELAQPIPRPLLGDELPQDDAKAEYVTLC